MAKIMDVVGNEMVRSVPKIKGVKPVGSQVLVELLTPQEILGTKLHVPDAASGSSGSIINGAPQGYVLDIGPNVAQSWGINKGDRVVLSGSFTPLPEAASQNGRAVACVDPNVIKAVLLE